MMGNYGMEKGYRKWSFLRSRSLKVDGVLAIACFSATALLAQPAQEGSTPSVASGTIEAFGEPFAKATPVANHLSKIFVYRANAVQLPQPINIYLEGRYHTSLLKGGFSEFCALPGAVSVQAILDDAGRQHLGKQEPGQVLQFEPGKTLYLRLQENPSAAPSLQTVNAGAAQAEMKSTRRQIHTVSRAKAVRECENGVEPQVLTALAAPVLPKLAPERKFALEADALFEFGKAELRATGYNAIETLTHKVKSEYQSVERIRVVGYTDAIGPQKLNLKLSKERALTVAEQIRASGIFPSKGIQTEGRGALELAKTECANKPTPENKKCHAPNRRVEVVVLGARR
jgi:OmpA-OmpF porin, OOP family